MGADGRPRRTGAEASGGPVATVSGVVERVLFARPADGFALLSLRPATGGPPLVLAGDIARFGVGESVRAEGVLEEDRSWGRRLRVTAVEPLAPRTAEAVAEYLGSGIVKGLGPRLAARLLARFGDELPSVLLEAPERLAEVRGIGPRTAARIGRAWRERAAEREALLFLQSHGLGARRARAVLEVFGEATVARVREDPYRLAREVRGIGFATADALARRLGIADDAPVRRVAALEEALRQAAEEGHSAVEQEALLETAASLLHQGADDFREALERALAEGRLARRRTGPLAYLLLPELDRAEADIAVDLERLAAGLPPWHPLDVGEALHGAAKALELELSERQRASLARLLEHKVSILTGGPGTGKTTLVRAFLAALRGRGLAIALAAPTGRAARRLAESTGHEASTLHRLLEAEPGRGFRRNRGRPLELDLLVVDETSMVDLPLAQATLAALPSRCALLLVGDADQLPSIGPGQLLADLIASGRLPVVRLTEIFRQAAESGIVTSAHRVNRGLPPRFSHDGRSGDCFGVRFERAEQATDLLLELVASRIPERFGLDPVRQLQVLCPTNRGALGTVELNRLLQERLNPRPAARLDHRGQRFALGDKVMQTENDYQREVYNGDIGTIVELDRRGRTLVVDMEGHHVRYEAADLERLVPAYAITVHKAQGSEYPAVVLVLAREHGRMLRRRLLYTAISRARRLLVVLAEPSALERAIRTADSERCSLLRHRLLGEVENRS